MTLCTAKKRDAGSAPRLPLHDATNNVAVATQARPTTRCRLIERRGFTSQRWNEGRSFTTRPRSGREETDVLATKPGGEFGAASAIGVARKVLDRSGRHGRGSWRGCRSGRTLNGRW